MLDKLLCIFTLLYIVFTLIVINSAPFVIYFESPLDYKELVNIEKECNIKFIRKFAMTPYKYELSIENSLAESINTEINKLEEIIEDRLKFIKMYAKNINYEVLKSDKIFASEVYYSLLSYYSSVGSVNTLKNGNFKFFAVKMEGNILNKLCVLIKTRGKVQGREYTPFPPDTEEARILRSLFEDISLMARTVKLF